MNHCPRADKNHGEQCVVHVQATNPKLTEIIDPHYQDNHSELLREARNHRTAWDRIRYFVYHTEATDLEIAEITSI
jgi:hypothetical protein